MYDDNVLDDDIEKLDLSKKKMTLKDESSKIYLVLCEEKSSLFSGTDATTLTRTEKQPNDFYISFCTKKRNTIPLVNSFNHINRIVKVSESAKRIYSELEDYQDTKYAYVKSLKKL